MQQKLMELNASLLQELSNKIEFFRVENIFEL